MGKTSFNGPVYGAKASLFSVHRGVVSSGVSTQVIASVTVPAYEDWVVTEVMAQLSSGSTSATVSLTDDSTVIAGSTAAVGASTEATAIATITAAGGEFEGYPVIAGSVLEVVGSASSVAMGSLDVNVRGFTRFRSSTRRER